MYGFNALWSRPDQRRLATQWVGGSSEARGSTSVDGSEAFVEKVCSLRRAPAPRSQASPSPLFVFYWSRARSHADPDLQQSVTEPFVKLYAYWLIYRRPPCPWILRTIPRFALEVEHDEGDTGLWSVAYKSASHRVARTSWPPRRRRCSGHPRGLHPERPPRQALSQDCAPSVLRPGHHYHRGLDPRRPEFEPARSGHPGPDFNDSHRQAHLPMSTSDDTAP